MEDTQGPEAPLSLENAPEKNMDTRDQMLSRHRKEIQRLQNKEVELKKAAAKGSKAEQKAKKKQVEEEISKLSATLKERHADELSYLGYADIAVAAKGSIDNLVKAIAGVSTAPQPYNKQPSKSAKRKEKRVQQEAVREQRIEEERKNMVNHRLVEHEELNWKLKPLGLTVSEIKPDGYCLYRAVEDQLCHLSGSSSSPYTFQKLRELVAAYMRDHASDFLPFFLPENELEGGGSEVLVGERFDSYCKEVEATAIWGGQLELEALSHCLKKHIVVFSGLAPDVKMGKEYWVGDGTRSSIKLSFHRHAYGLGDHYNSVNPL